MGGRPGVVTGGEAAGAASDATRDDLADASVVSASIANAPMPDGSASLPPLDGADASRLAHSVEDSPASVDERDLDAFFIGTDYHYAFNRNVRDLFAVHALHPAEVALPLEVGGPAVGWGAAPDGVALGGWGAGAAAMGMGGTVHNPPLAPFSKSVLFGVVLAFYMTVAILVASAATQHLLSRMSTRQREETWHWCILPALAFFMDRMTCSVFRATERPLLLIIKGVIWMLFILLPVLAFSWSARRYMLARDVLDLVVPVIALVYSLVLYVYRSAERPIQ